MPLPIADLLLQARPSTRSAGLSHTNIFVKIENKEGMVRDGACDAILPCNCSNYIRKACRRPIQSASAEPAKF